MVQDSVVIEAARARAPRVNWIASIPFLLEAAAVLVAFVHWHASPAQSHSESMLMGIHSLAAYLQLQVVWVYHDRILIVNYGV
ncbi:hypothetical protein FYF80_03055 [Vibrio vulnificus]|nr:hypothetical protein [Vibrio vulnificus]